MYAGDAPGAKGTDAYMELAAQDDDDDPRQVDNQPVYDNRPVRPAFL